MSILLVVGLLGCVICGYHFLVACSDPEGRGGATVNFAFFGFLASVAVSGFAVWRLFA